MTQSYTYDENFVRYQLIKTNPGQNFYDWIFLPGGPGADSIYYLSLIESLDVIGNFWLIDFPGNGTNLQKTQAADFDNWENYFIPAIKRFQKPILVGQSFGGMFPLLFPELEQLLQGFIILNSAPSLWLEEAARYAAEHNINRMTEEGKEFRANPTPDNFKKTLLAGAHCHFPPSSLERGKKLFADLPFNYHAMLWWIQKVNAINFNAKWIPQKIPTLIMGGKQDFVVPCSLFETDHRFHRRNIIINNLDQAGHFIWIDQADTVKKSFQEFANLLDDN